ncbi:ribosomal phosphoprotein [Reticulomyxa filosa]|uniref:Ribosomal phosphoprotein n=1 Tax=Reticulomyxa filosa TaxID=46433 RepID=X6N8Y1_RETFI|nr:ribosomal phosphoprotein [Reticulomyxa filosa]|eukprot:ETO22491.1 ribosomal phosphoprotein [Reticulomyxa filosa]
MALLDLCRGNSGFFFTKGDIGTLRKEITSRQVQTPAKAGAIAPVDVFIPPGPTGMEPTQTTFFQTMNIGTRINRGQIDITDEVHLIKQGEKLLLLFSLTMIVVCVFHFPNNFFFLRDSATVVFFYLLLTRILNLKLQCVFCKQVKSVYDNGDAYDASALDITSQDVANGFVAGLRQVAAFSFGINHPTAATVPHSTLNAYKKVLALGLSLEKYSWENLDVVSFLFFFLYVKKVLENPGAFAAAAAPTTGAATTTAAAAKEEPEAEAEKESSAAPADPFGGGGDSGADFLLTFSTQQLHQNNFQDDLLQLKISNAIENIVNNVKINKNKKYFCHLYLRQDFYLDHK